jgi:hypothetical protein
MPITSWRPSTSNVSCEQFSFGIPFLHLFRLLYFKKIRVNPLTKAALGHSVRWIYDMQLSLNSLILKLVKKSGCQLLCLLAPGPKL